MKVQNIHPHRMPTGGMAFTFQIVHNEETVPLVYELELAEAAWLARQLNQMIYEEVSK